MKTGVRLLRKPGKYHNLSSGSDATPNPVTTTSNIEYSGTENATVNISIYDIYGRFIDEVADAVRISGENCATFDATDLTPGIYIVHMQSVGEVADSKMVVVK